MDVVAPRGGQGLADVLLAGLVVFSLCGRGRLLAGRRALANMHASHLNMRQVEFDVRALAAELRERRLLDVALVVALHHIICKRRTEGTVKKSSELCGGEQASRELACEVL